MKNAAFLWKVGVVFYAGVVFLVKLWVVRSCEVWSWLSAGHDPWHRDPNILFTAPGETETRYFDHLASFSLALSLFGISVSSSAVETNRDLKGGVS